LGVCVRRHFFPLSIFTWFFVIYRVATELAAALDHDLFLLAGLGLGAAEALLNARSIAALLLVVATGAMAQDMKPPRITVTRVDWDAVAATLAAIEPLQAAQARVEAAKDKPDTAKPNDAMATKLAQLNAATAKLFPNIAASPVPVLLPLDVDAFLRERPSGEITPEARARYLAGFGTPSFFLPGPSGYDAAFEVKVSDIPDLAGIRYARPIEVQISGSALIYDLDEAKPPQGKPVPELESEFPGIQRFLHESFVRYTFVKFGAPYVVEILCFDGGYPRFHKPTCRSADRLAIRFLQALHIAGGTPHKPHVLSPPQIKRPQQVSPTFSYYSPGWLLPGTGFRDLGGDVDYTAYSQIRFPIAKAPTFVNSQTFQSRNKRHDPDSKVSPNYEYPWRDNFCERRAFAVGQCPAGAGHQGEDIRPPKCIPDPGQDRCERHSYVVAVRDGVIMRGPKQESAYVVVNTASEHIRFRYLHMNPKKMDEDGLLNGRVVVQGEFLGEVGTFSGRDGGTSYHLHFDVQVPSKYGWVYVNPYMTLVNAYERLTGARGTEVKRPVPMPPAAPTGDVAKDGGKKQANARDKVATADDKARFATTSAKDTRSDEQKLDAARCESKRLSQRARRKLCGADVRSRASAKRKHHLRKVARHFSRKSHRWRHHRRHLRRHHRRY
jgi:murein DD-endopeptidase MepM/ murein hydrolase activator NlpD